MAKKPTTIKDKYTKTQILDHIAESTELSRKEVASVLDELANVIEGHIKKRAVGEFVLPGLMKITTVHKPAVKARKGINPFTKEEQMFKAKPATTVVKVRPLSIRLPMSRLPRAYSIPPPISWDEVSAPEATSKK